MVQNNPSKSISHPWVYSSGRWERIHCDFAGPFAGSMFLICVDAYSKWPEVFEVKSTTSDFKHITLLNSMNQTDVK